MAVISDALNAAPDGRPVHPPDGESGAEVGRGEPDASSGVSELRGSAAPVPSAPAPSAPARDDDGENSLVRLDAVTSLTLPARREAVLQNGSELFRRLYSRLGGGRQEVLAVTSAVAGEGKTTVALGLGVTIAEDFPERRVLIVETDVQRQALAGDFDVPPTPGLMDCLVNNEPIEVGYRATLMDNLQILPAGTNIPNPGRWLRSSAMALAVDGMRATHDLVILDLPAILNQTDAVLLSDLADSILFVVRAGVTPAAVVSKALEDIDTDRLRGTVLNETRSAIPRWLQRLCGL